MNLDVFRAINGWPDGLAPFFIFWSDANKWTWVRICLLAIVVAMLWRGPKSRKAILLTLIAVGLSNELTDILKATFPQLRPCVELSDLYLRTGKLTSFGTASAHSANMAAVATVFLRRMGPWGYIWVAVALFTGLSRIYLGVHYPNQVLLGWTCGIGMALLTTEVYRWFEKRKELKADQLGSLTEPESRL